MTDKTFDELKKEAETIGFKFEFREWEADDYTLDDDEKEHWFKSKAKAWKVTFPADYPRPFTMITIEDAAAMTRSLRYAIDEYGRRAEIAKEDAERSRQNIEVVNRLAKMMRGNKDNGKSQV